MESLVTANKILENLAAEHSSDCESDAAEDNWWTKSNKNS